MRDIDTDTQNALDAGTLVARDFLRIVARNFETGEAEAANFWSDIGVVSVAVENVDTGGTSTYDFSGALDLISIDDIPMQTGIAVRTVRVQLAQASDEVINFVRGYDLRLAPVQVWRGLFNTDTGSLIAPPKSRFLGFVDRAPITTPKAGQSGSVGLDCVSHTRELTRANSANRSDEQQKLRSGDRFRRYTATIGTVEIYWGQNKGKVGGNSPVYDAWSRLGLGGS